MERKDADKTIKKLRRNVVVAYMISVCVLFFCFSDLCAQARGELYSYLNGNNRNETVVTAAVTEPVSEVVEEEVIVEPEEEPIGVVVIKTWQLNVRQTPNGKIMGTVSMDEEHAYYEKDGGWLRIKYEDEDGYIASRYCDKYDLNNCLVEYANIPEPEPVPEPEPELQPEPQSESQPEPEPEPQPESQPESRSEPQPEQNTDITQWTNAQLCQYIVTVLREQTSNDYEMVTAINDFLCRRMEYDLDYYTTRDALVEGKGRCLGYANAFKSLCTEAGIPTDLVYGYAYNSFSSKHAWNRVYIDGQYYCVDVTFNDSYGSNVVLLVPEEKFNQNAEIHGYNPANADIVE